MMLPISYAMRNLINDTQVAIAGDGHWYEDGTTALNLEISDTAPDLWNPIVLPCICSGPGPGPKPHAQGNSGGLIGIAPEGYRTAPGTLRRATLWDESGMPVAEVSATGLYRKSGTGLDFQIDVETVVLNGPLLKSLSKIEHYGFSVIPQSQNMLAVTSHYSLSAITGQQVFGATSITYECLGSAHSLEGTLVGSNAIVLQQRGFVVQYITRQQVKYERGLGIKKSKLAPLS